MLHRTVRIVQRAALRQSSHRQYGYVHGFISRPGPFHTITRSLHDDSDAPPSSEVSSHERWSVDKISVLQSEMATTKLQLGHLKETTDTQMSGLQTGLTSQINALNSKFDSKFDTFEKHVSDMMKLHKAELNQQISDMMKELHRHEVTLVWRVVFALATLTAVAVGGSATLYMRDRVLPQQTEEK